MRLSRCFAVLGLFCLGMAFFQLRPTSTSPPLKHAVVEGSSITLTESQESWITIPLENRTTRPICIAGVRPFCCKEGCFGREGAGFPISIPAGEVARIKIKARGDMIGAIYPKIRLYADVPDSPEVEVEVGMNVGPAR